MAGVKVVKALSQIQEEQFESAVEDCISKTSGKKSQGPDMTDRIPTTLPVNDTIVVCRPNQVREAAVVLSCLPKEIFTPLVVLEDPPMSEQQYRKFYEDYRSARDERDDVIGGELGRSVLLNGAKLTPEDVELLSFKVDQKAELLTPYRSWVKHNQLIRELLRPLALRRAVFLFDARPEELRVIEPAPLEHISDEHFAILPENIEWIGLLHGNIESGHSLHADVYQNLADLSRCAWRLCRPNDPWPNDRIQVPESDLASFFDGLLLALNSNKPLLPIGDETIHDGRLRVSEIDQGDQAARSQQAVLIEVSNDAAKLLGVLYGYWNKARLVLTPQPELSNVQKAVRALQEARSAAARSSRSPDALAAPIRDLEKAVSELVQDETVSVVADLPLNAVTDGVPYNFVKKSGADWSMKPIAHVAGDISLLLLTELLQGNPSNDIGFNLIFDPGFFKTTETRDVLSELRDRVSYSLLLSQESSSTVALLSLGAWLPVELLYFNTHGSDHSVIFADMPMPAFKIVQRLTLPTHPVIFNNSCLSWTGVGREFIRCGARGYIGTLWSVDAVQAKDYARQVISRLVHQNTEASRAMLATGVVPEDERAYIFVGTANTRLARSQAGDSSKEKQRKCETARRLFDAAIAVQKTAGIHSSLPFASSLVRLLCNEAEFVSSQIDNTWPTADLDRLDLLLCNCDAHLIIAHKTDADIAKLGALLQQAVKVVKSLPLDQKTAAKWDARILHLFGRMAASSGRMQEAIDFLNGSIASANVAGEPAGWQQLELSDVYKALGNNAATDAARKGLEIFRIQGPSKENQAGELRAIGRLGQLANRSRNYQEALRYAQEGYQKAIVADDPREKASFKGDEARVYIRLEQYDLALAAAIEAVKLARHVRDDLMEVGAYGIVTQALIGKGDYDKALEKANDGLFQARRRQFHSEIGDFLSDIATIRGLQNDLPRAMAYLEQAAQVFAEAGQVAKVQHTLAKASEIVRKLGTWEIRYRMMKLEIAVIERLDQEGRRMITMDLISGLKAEISKVGFAKLQEPLKILLNELHTTMQKRGNQCSEQLIFIFRVVQMFHNRSLGEVSAPKEEAAQLDLMSAGGFKFTEFLQTTN